MEINGVIEAEIVTSSDVVVDSKLPEVVIDVSQSMTAEVDPQNYVLASVGSTSGSMLDAIPTWVRTVIDEELANGGDIKSILDLIRTDLFAYIEDGVNQRISTIEKEYVSTSSLTTTLGSTLNGNYAKIIDMANTYVTPTSAQTIVLNAQKSIFGGNGDKTAAEAFIGSVALTKVTATTSYASDIALLRTDLNGQSVQILSLDEITMKSKNDILALQSQIDGALSTWFYSYSPEYSSVDTTVALQSTSTNTGTELITGALVFEVVYNQMYKYIGTYVANYDLTTAIFSNTALWTPVYKMKLPEAGWLAKDAGASEDRHSLSVDSKLELVTNALVYHVETDQMYKFLPLVAENNVNLTLETWSNTARWGAVAHTKVSTTRGLHIGDLFYDNTTGYAYRYTYENIPNDNPDQGIVYSWVRVVDTDIAAALAQAAAAQATADGKTTTYYKTTNEMLAIVTTWTAQQKLDNEGDIWVDKDTGVTRVWSSAIIPPATTPVGWVHSETEWSAKSVKFIQNVNTGELTGWELSDGSNQNSEFKIVADVFKVVGSNQTANAVAPFSVDTNTGDINFNGTVNINKLSSSMYIGEHATGPVSPILIGTTSYVIKKGDTYKNSVDGIVYYYSITNNVGAWLSTKGDTGITTHVVTLYRQTLDTPVNAPTGVIYTASSNTLTNIGVWSPTQPTSSTTPTYATTYTYTTNTPTVAITSGTWTTPVVVARNALGGSNVDMVYVSLPIGNTPATPTSSANPPLTPITWYGTVVEAKTANSTGILWSSTGYTAAGGTTWTWNAPIKVEGIDSTSTSYVEISAYCRKAGTAPGMPTSGGIYDFSTKTLTTVPVTTGVTWSSGIPTGTDPLYVIRTTADVLPPATTDSSLVWSTPIKMAENSDTIFTKTYYILGLIGGAVPAVITSSTYTIASNSFAYSSTAIWLETAPAATSTHMVYSTSGTFKSVAGVATSTCTLWSTPIVYSRNGSDGTSISGVTNYYLASASSSGVTTATAGWTTTVQNPTVSLPYLWNYESITYSSGSPTVTTPSIIGNYAANGTPGRGISSITEYYAVSASNSIAPTVWTTTLQTTSTANPYLWNYERITYTDTTTEDSTKRVIGTHGATGITGNSVNIVFKVTATTTAPTISGTSALPTGWSDGIGEANSTLSSSTPYMWYAEGTSVAGVWTWGTPSLNTATQIAELTLYKLNDTAIATAGSYNFATGVLSGQEAGWTTTVPGLVNNGDKVYITNAIVTGAKDSIVTPVWSTPVIYAQRTDGVTGADGKPGEIGPRGSKSAIITTALTTDPTTTQLYTALGLQTGDITMVGDNIQYTRSDINGGTFTKYAIAPYGNPGAWSSAISLYVNGNALITGTVTASALAASSVTAEKITVGMGGSNQLKNSMPQIGGESSGWKILYASTAAYPVVSAGVSPYIPTGGAGVMSTVTGVCAVGTYFRMGPTTAIPVTPGERYEYSSLLSVHNLSGSLQVSCYTTNGTLVGYVSAVTGITTRHSGDISTWTRYGGFITIPATTAYVYPIVVGIVTNSSVSTQGITASMLYFGKALVNQTVLSPWSGESGDGLIVSNDFSSIGGTGFRLKSNAAGTNTDPTIYGAAIRAGTLYSTTFDIASMKVVCGSPSHTGSLIPSDSKALLASGVATVETISEYFYGPLYGSGYLQRRIATSATTFNISAHGYSAQGSTAITTYINIYASINDGAWYQVGVANLYSSYSLIYSFNISTEMLRIKAVATAPGSVPQINVTLVVSAPATL